MLATWNLQGDLFDEVKRRGGRLPEVQVVQGVSQFHCAFPQGYLNIRSGHVACCLVVCLTKLELPYYANGASMQMQEPRARTSAS